MSTATSGLNEFPVLLRLPDLNAPVWAPLPAGSPNLAPPTPAVTTAETAPAVAEPPHPVAVEAISLTVASGQEAYASTPGEGPMPEGTSHPLTRIPPPSPQLRPMWRQLVTGGVLVGGLALTYLLTMAGGSHDDPPSDASTAELSVEIPTEMAHSVAPPPTEGGPVVVRPARDHDSSGIAHVPPPPDFGRDWNRTTIPPSHIEVADLPRHEPMHYRGPGDHFQPAEGNGDFAPRVDTQATPPESRYEGRIGPDASTMSLPAYPTTDPSTFLYRPIYDDASRADTASREAATYPPPLR